MPRYGMLRQARYDVLITEYFTPLEARELSVLAKNTPALRLIRQDRLARRARFEKIAARRIERRLWRRSQVPGKWLSNLTRMYTKNGWRVQTGGKGRQPRMPRFSPNPWAMYRDYVKRTPDKGYKSPWELRQIKAGKTLLDKGLIYIEKQVRRGGTVAGVPQKMIRSWIEQKDAAIAKAKGKHRRELIEQRARLERSLG